MAALPGPLHRCSLAGVLISSEYPRRTSSHQRFCWQRFHLGSGWISMQDRDAWSRLNHPPTKTQYRVKQLRINLRLLLRVRRELPANCRGGTPWPPLRTSSIILKGVRQPKRGGHGVPPLQVLEFCKPTNLRGSFDQERHGTTLLDMNAAIHGNAARFHDHVIIYDLNTSVPRFNFFEGSTKRKGKFFVTELERSVAKI